MTTDGKITPELTGVPETLLWTLFHRATEARRPDTVLADPLAVHLVDSIDYPFAERFGPDVALRAQWQALRTRRFDDEVRRFLTVHPDGTVVALGEGLETQFSRVDNGRVRWVGVDLPPVVELRRRLLPTGARVRSIAGSALDGGWIEAIGPTEGLLITAQGLLMYLPRSDVHALLTTIAGRLRGASMVFDATLRWLTARTQTGELRAGAGGYVPPPMLWGIDRDELKALRRLPHIESLRRLSLPRGRGPLFGYAAPALDWVPGLRALTPVWILRTRFQPACPEPTLP